MTHEHIMQVLTQLWKDVLKVPVIGTEQSFFEAGGNPRLAAALFREIAKITGIEMPSVTIYQAPTISKLSLLLASGQVPHCPPVLVVKPGTDNPPVFLAHGIGGDAMQLFDVVQNLQVRNALYATQARGIDGLDEPLDRVEEMADFYLQAIRNTQPQGPYFLVGYSFGGLVMMEIAQRLLAIGEQIGLLTMLDSYPHRKHLRQDQQLSTLISVARHRLFAGRSSAVRNNEKYVNSTMQVARKRIYHGELLALRRYQPKFYSGKVNFVRAETVSYFPKDPCRVWSHLMREFTLETVAGNHTSLLTTHYETIAKLLNSQLMLALNANSVRNIQS